MANLAGWPWWKVVSITGQSGAGADYPVKFEIGDSAGGDFHLGGRCTNFPQDIRITDNDGTTLLDHFVEDLTADPIKVWVEVKDDLGSNRDIRVYYGKNGESTASNIGNTFLLGDDFADGDYTSNPTWTAAAGTWSAATNKLISSTTNGYIYTPSTYDSNGMRWHTKITYKGIYTQFAIIADNDGDYLQQIQLYRVSANTLKLEIYREAGQNTDIISTAHTPVVNTEYIIDITRDSSGNWELFVDHVSKGTGLQATLPTNTGYLKLRSSWTATPSNYFDDIFVGKFIANGPAFSSAGAEQSPTGVSPTAVFYGPFVGPFGGPI